MSNPPLPTIEQKLTVLYAIDPAGDFVDWLGKDLLAQKQNTAKPPVWRQWGINLQPRRGWTRLALAGAVILVLAAFLLATPQGRAWAQEVIHFFTRASSDILPGPTAAPLVWVDVTPGEPVPTATPRAAFTDCGDFTDPKCSMEQIRSKVDFPVLELGTIPQSLHFVGATGGPDRVALFYDNGEYTYGLVIIEEPWTGDSEFTKWNIGVSAVVETVQIGNVNGEYVKGAFVASFPYPDPFATPTPGAINQTWDVNAGSEALHWIENGIFFSMESYGPNILMDRDAFVALAEGLTTEPVSAGLLPVPATATPASISFNGVHYNYSVSQAEEQAGFDVLEPGRLPEVLLLAGASYQPEYHIVRIFYIQPSLVLNHTFGLTVAEELAPIGEECLLCDMVVGDYGDFLTEKNDMIVGADAVIETVQVSDFTGQYVEGLWMQSNSGWIWLPEPAVKTLRWQANGMAFELQYSGFWINNQVPISKADLLAIAESMK